MKRNDITKLFKRAVKEYLEYEKPRYKNGRYPISEKDLQREFAGVLMDENVPFRTEVVYPGTKKRIDFRIYSDPNDRFNVETEVEIEWEAKWTDGFAKRTFEDLQKLNGIPKGRWGMFLAVNIGNKYQRPSDRSTRTTTKAESFFKKNGKPTFLHREWYKKVTKGSGALLRCNPRFWRWRYDNRCDVTVLSCFGRRTRDGWVSH